MEISDNGNLDEIQAISAKSHRLEAEVRHGILEQPKSQSSEVVGAREILDLAGAFSWVTNPAQAHGGR